MFCEKIVNSQKSEIIFDNFIRKNQKFKNMNFKHEYIF